MFSTSFTEALVFPTKNHNSEHAHCVVPSHESAAQSQKETHLAVRTKEARNFN